MKVATKMFLTKEIGAQARNAKHTIKIIFFCRENRTRLLLLNASIK